MRADPAWIDTTDALRELVSEIGATSIGFDTEADSLHHYPEKLCLLQLSFDGRHALVDPLAGVDLAPLKPVFHDTAIRKIVHGGDFDVRILRRDTEIAPRRLFDTMVAARLCGEDAVGLSALLHKLLGVTLDKAMQRADWSRRPLPASMIAYAVEDTRHLEALCGRLEERLAALGRTGWAEEEFVRLESVRWAPTRPEPEPFRRVKGAARLDPRALAVLAELWSWRDERARRRDKPPFKVLRDEAMVAIAQSPPSDLAELGEIAGVGPRLAGSPAGREIMEAVARGLATPEAERPCRLDHRPPRNDPAFDRRVAELRRQRDAVARGLGLEGAVIAGRALLEAIQRKIDEGEDPTTIPELRIWQWSLLRDGVST